MRTGAVGAPSPGKGHVPCGQTRTFRATQRLHSQGLTRENRHLQPERPVQPPPATPKRPPSSRWIKKTRVHPLSGMLVCDIKK